MLYFLKRLIPARAKHYIRRKINEPKRKKAYQQRLQHLKASGVISEIRSPKNIILIVLDCLRVDYLKDDICPFLSFLANSSIFSKKNISASNWTYPSVISLLSGLYPHTHGGQIVDKIGNDHSLPALFNSNTVFIQDILNCNGYFTSCYYTIPWVRFLQETFCVSAPLYNQPANFVFSKVAKDLTRIRENFFIYIHLGDLHAPIKVPTEYKNFLKVENLPNLEKWDFQNGVNLNASEFQRYKTNRIKLYKAVIRFVDDELRKFFNFLEKNKLNQNTLVIITSDHGEEFWEHVKIEKQLFFDPRNIYGVGHGHCFFNCVIETPVIIAKLAENESKIFELTSSVDVVPTILDELNYEGKHLFDGLVFGKRKMNDIIISEAPYYGYTKKKAIIQYPFKLITSPDDGVDLLFNINKDTEENEPIYDNQLIVTLKNSLQIVKNDEPQESIIDLSEEDEVKKHLKNLGYM